MNSPLPLPIIPMKNYLFMLITQQVNSVSASTTPFQDAELISESLGEWRGMLQIQSLFPWPQAPHNLLRSLLEPAAPSIFLVLHCPPQPLLSPGLFILVQTRLGLESFGCQRGQKWGWDVPVDFFCCWCAKYEQVQPQMLRCGAVSGWILDKSTVSDPQEMIFPRRAAFELLQVKT